MKLFKFKIKIEIEPLYVYPFTFLFDWIEDAKDLHDYWKVRRKFKKLNWNDDQVWKLTSYAGSLVEAIDMLTHELTDNRRLFPKIRKLVDAGFERDWR